MDFVPRASNARPRGQKRDFWCICRNSLIRSPVTRGLRGGLGIEAPDYLKARSGRPLRGLPRLSHYPPTPPDRTDTVARCAAKAYFSGSLGGAKPPRGRHISGRGGANWTVDGGFVSYRLSWSGMDFVSRASNARPGGQKRDFWCICRNSLIHSPVTRGLRGGLHHPLKNWVAEKYTFLLNPEQTDENHQQPNSRKRSLIPILLP